MARFQKRAPSGNILTASWRGKDIGSHVCGVRYAGGSVGRGFQIHPRGARTAHRILFARLLGLRGPEL